METRKRKTIYNKVWAVFLIIIIILIKIATFYPRWIEKNYSSGFYPKISNVYRLVWGRIPFSLGDVLYAIAGFLLFTLIIRLVKGVVKKRFKLINYKRIFAKAFFICCVIYIFFNISWGLNYNRLGIAHQLQLDVKEYSVEDLKNITTLLETKLNQDRLALGATKLIYPKYSQMFDQAEIAYQNATTNYPFLTYENRSVKRSLYGRLGNTLGFLGYYNPFTGEAQLNLTQPRFLIPFVTCHEMGHQLGYASESEANFVGYLAAVSSKDTLFHYSAYFDLFNYANGELFLRDSLAARQNFIKLDTLVKADVHELREYWRKSDNIVEPFIRIFYDQYLKANQQDKGVKSYNEVIGWLIAYNKKYNRL